jgi:lipopolysaccharide transport system permease protein
MVARIKNLEEEMLLPDISRQERFRQNVKELWQFRELLYFFVWKDVKVKYKQTTLGIAWAILQPLLGMVLFTIIFGKVAKLPSDGIPYPVFYYTALISWTYFSTALLMSSNSIVNNSYIISKVYFPRMFLPAGGVLSGILDLTIAIIILCCLLAYYGISLNLSIALLPLVFVPLMVFAFGAGLFLAALNVNFRDVRHALPFALQVWMFASPVVYPSSMFPEEYQWVLPLNPIAGIIETTRALIANGPIPWKSLGISNCIVLFSLIIGIWYFRRTERRFADVV